jgi:hypothetical protein
MKNLLSVGVLLAGAVGASARAVAGSPRDWIMPYKREALQDIVSQDLVGCVWSEGLMVPDRLRGTSNRSSSMESVSSCTVEKFTHSGMLPSNELSTKRGADEEQLAGRRSVH